MRILMVHPGPDFSVADVYRGWAEALRELGCEVALYNSNDRLMFYAKALIDTGDHDETGHPLVKQAMNIPDAITAAMQGLTHACYMFWPDAVLFVSGFFIKDGIFDLMRRRNHKLVMLHTESPYQEAEQLNRAKFMDVNLLNDPANIETYDRLGVPALYMPHAYRPAVHYPRREARNPALASDLVFIGTAFRSRIDFFEAMDFSGTDFLLGGSNWDEDLDDNSPLRKFIDQDAKGCVDNDQTAELYRNAKCGINFYRRESEEERKGQGWAMGPRETEMAACGLFFLRDPRPESDQVLWMLPSFAGPDDASDQVKWWLKHDAEREDAVVAALRAVQDRTFTANAKRLLDVLEGL